MPRIKDRATVIRDVAELIAVCFRALVDREDEVVVDTWHNERHCIFTVFIHPADMAFALGKGGENADAVRSFVLAACRKNSLKYELDVQEKRYEDNRRRQ